MNNLNNLYNALIEGGYFTSNEIDLVTYINGWSKESFSDMMYCRYGYHELTDLEEYCTPIY